MSAVVVPLSPRSVRGVPGRGGSGRPGLSVPRPGSAGPGEGSAATARPGGAEGCRLRLVAGGAEEPGGARGEGAALRRRGPWAASIPPGGDVVDGVPLRPVVTPRRPGPPLVLRTSVGGAVGRLEGVAPRHPAVRAARRRLREEGEGLARGAGAPAARLGARPGVRSGPLRRRSEAAGARGAAVRHAATFPSWTLSGLPGSARRPGLGAAVRLTALLLTVGTLASALVAGGAGALAASEPSEGLVTSSAVVRPGQTLWEVASATGSSDTAAAVEQIVRLNNLQDSTLHPGQRLIVPVY